VKIKRVVKLALGPVETMVALTLNYNKMGMKPRGESWEWYTVEIGRIAAIHIYNKTASGNWTFHIVTMRRMESTKEYDSKEDALSAAIFAFKGEVLAAITAIENINVES
jgi:hypothetical protein